MMLVAAMLTNVTGHPWIILADSSYRVWGRFDHGRAGFGRTELVLIMGATVLVVATWLISNWITRRQKATFMSNSSSKLFRELCRAHRVPRTDRRLLKKLAAAQGVENAAELFIEPEHFEAAKLPAALKSSAHELREIRHRLFD